MQKEAEVPHCLCCHPTITDNKRHSEILQQIRRNGGGGGVICHLFVLLHLISSDMHVVIYGNRYPVLAMGIVYWVDCMVQDPTFFQRLTDNTPVHLLLLDEVSLFTHVFFLLQILLHLQIINKLVLSFCTYAYKGNSYQACKIAIDFTYWMSHHASCVMSIHECTKPLVVYCNVCGKALISTNLIKAIYGDLL